MTVLSADIIGLIADHSDCKSLMRLLMTCRAYYRIWMDMRSYTAVVRTSAELDKYIRDGNILTIFIAASSSFSNERTDTSHIPQRALKIIGTGTNNLFLRIREHYAGLAMQIEICQMTIFGLTVASPKWKISMHDCCIKSGLSITANKVVMNRLTIEEGLYINAVSISMTDVKTPSSKSYRRLYNIFAETLTLHRFCGYYNKWKLHNSNDIHISGCEFNYENSVFLSINLTDGLRCLLLENCIFKSSYSDSPYPNRVISMNGMKQSYANLIQIKGNRIITNTGREYGDEAILGNDET